MKAIALNEQDWDIIINFLDNNMPAFVKWCKEVGASRSDAERIVVEMVSKLDPDEEVKTNG